MDSGQFKKLSDLTDSTANSQNCESTGISVMYIPVGEVKSKDSIYLYPNIYRNT